MSLHHRMTAAQYIAHFKPNEPHEDGDLELSDAESRVGDTSMESPAMGWTTKLHIMVPKSRCFLPWRADKDVGYSLPGLCDIIHSLCNKHYDDTPVICQLVYATNSWSVHKSFIHPIFFLKNGCDIRVSLSICKQREPTISTTTRFNWNQQWLGPGPRNKITYSKCGLKYVRHLKTIKFGCSQICALSH
jgi:hypothetical protein